MLKTQIENSMKECGIIGLLRADYDDKLSTLSLRYEISHIHGVDVRLYSINCEALIDLCNDNIVECGVNQTNIEDGIKNKELFNIWNDLLYSLTD